MSKKNQIKFIENLKSQNWTGIIIESFLIVLSILLALIINENRADNEKEQLRVNTLQNIKNELTDNSKELTLLINNHKEKAKKLSTVIASLQNKETINRSAITYMQELGNVALKRTALSNTAWETSKITDGLSLLENKQINQLSKLYNLQENSVEDVWNVLASHILSKSMFKKGETLLNLTIFRVYLVELFRQEEYLKVQIDKQIESL